MSAKTLLDTAAAAIGLLVLAPVMGVVALLIAVRGGGPAIFRQVRVGQNGRPFTCLKFRTMAQGTPSVATHKVDPSQITRLGRVLRRFKLDELPQLVNVLRGEMSLVGPRPCLPSQSELIEARKERGILALRPGITGLAQVRGIDMRDPALLASVDAEYAAHQSLRLDLLIVAATFLPPLRRLA